MRAASQRRALLLGLALALFAVAALWLLQRAGERPDRRLSTSAFTVEDGVEVERQGRAELATIDAAVAAEAPVPSSERALFLRIRARDACGTRVESLTLRSTETPERFSPIEVTLEPRGEHGVGSFSIEESWLGRTAWAESPLHGREPVELTGSLEVEFTQRTNALHGTVAWPKDLEADPECTVFAWPSELDAPSEALRRAMEGQSSFVRAVRPSSSGAFHFDGLDAGRDYHVLALCRGFVSGSGAPERARVGACPLRLSMRAVLGVRLRLVDPAGRPILPPEGLSTIDFERGPGRPRMIRPPSWSAIVGAEAGDFPGESLWLTLAEVREIPPARVMARVPGYDSPSVSPVTPTWAGEELAVGAIELRRNAVELATLELRLIRCPVAEEELPTMSPPCRVLLTNIATKERLRFEFDRATLLTRLTGIPRGEHHVTYEFYGAPSSDGRIETVGDRTQPMSVSLWRFCAVRVVFPDAARLPWPPYRTEVGIDPPAGYSGARFRFRGPPYVLPHLERRTYVFRHAGREIHAAANNTFVNEVAFD